jgi:hypothetical protein
LAKPIMGYSKKIIIIFPAITDVKVIGLSVGNVQCALYGRYKKAHGMKWKYLSIEQYEQLKKNPKVKHYAGDIGQHTN